MIHPLVKLITVDGFMSTEQSESLFNSVKNLQYTESEFGKQIENFNLLAPDVDEQFSVLLNTKFETDKERSGIFRFPSLFIHFEDFTSLNDWIFVVALQQSTFNVYENHHGYKSALEEHKLGYRNLFEWDLTINYILKPGQGILFRPWLFHSFDTGLIQTFRLKEHGS